MNYEKRNLVTCILLSVVTCGIYGIYWLYKIMDDLYRLNGEESKAAMDIVLSLVTCGIYLMYRNYQWGKQMYSIKEKYGISPVSDDSVLYLILSIFGLSIVNYCIIQSALNDQIIDRANGSQY